MSEAAEESVPRLSRVQLYEHMSPLNKPFTNDLDNPLTEPILFMHTENEGLAKWGSHVGANLDQGFRVGDEETTNEKRVFDNSYIAAYELMRRSYETHDLVVPTIAIPPNEYDWLGFAEPPTIGEMFIAYNNRQLEVFNEYRDYLEVLATWGSERMAFRTDNQIGMTAIAGAEVYLAFRDHTEDAPQTD